MKFDHESVRKMKRWHVPSCIVTLATGIYLVLISLVPSFNQEYHEMIFQGNFFLLLPYAIFILIGSPILSLMCYTKLETDEQFREQLESCESD